jgi:hypothetical protein
MRYDLESGPRQLVQHGPTVAQDLAADPPTIPCAIRRGARSLRADGKDWHPTGSQAALHAPRICGQRYKPLGSAWSKHWCCTLAALARPLSVAGCRRDVPVQGPAPVCPTPARPPEYQAAGALFREEVFDAVDAQMPNLLPYFRTGDALTARWEGGPGRRQVHWSTLGHLPRSSTDVVTLLKARAELCDLPWDQQAVSAETQFRLASDRARDVHWMCACASGRR